jgi:glycolate oxidase FAD binding subunit
VGLSSAERLHPTSTAELVDLVRRADEDGSRLLVVGGRRHLDKGNPTEIDAELWTTQLDRIVTYEPPEMVAVVEAGVRVGSLQRALAEGGQEWPVDAPEDATVGGVIAAGASSFRRLKVGAARDSVLEVALVTGDGRLIRSGARTVKNVTGYDLHKVAVGSLGTLGVIVEVALKVRPLPHAAASVRLEGGFDVAREVLTSVPAAACLLVTADGVEVRLEGWTREVAEQLEALGDRVSPLEAFASSRAWDDQPIVAEIAVSPSRLASALEDENAFGALAGVGIAWVGVEDQHALRSLRERVAALGGIAPVIRGAGGLGADAIAAPEIHRRLKDALDPNGVLAPGRGWGGI